MNKSVIISVKGTQTVANNSNILELITEGVFYRKGESYYLTYNESKVTGMEGTITTLQIKNGIVTLIRCGTVNSQFVFEEGQRHMSYYDTSNGNFTVGVVTNEVSVNVDDDGGEIWVDYSLEINNNKSGENDFYLNIREAGKIKKDESDFFVTAGIL